MKKLIIMSCLMAVVSFASGKINSSMNSTQSVSEVLHMETKTFKVYGNCAMCKKRIESSLESVKGVSEATWDVDSKLLTVTFDPHVITLDKIKETIAKAGHDTDEVKTSEKVYNKLPGCCQYERAK